MRYKGVRNDNNNKESKSTGKIHELKHGFEVKRYPVRYVPTIHVIRKGTQLYHGTHRGKIRESLLFLSPVRAVAEGYGKVMTVTVKQDLMLATKRDVLHLLDKGARGNEWELFGASEGNYPRARKLCRKGWLDGWIHEPKSPYFAEVMLCTLDKIKLGSLAAATRMADR